MSQHASSSARINSFASRCRSWADDDAGSVEREEREERGGGRVGGELD